MSIYGRQTAGNTLRGLFIAATVAAISTCLAGCQPKNVSPTKNCSCTCKATTAGGSKITTTQTIPLGSAATCGLHEGEACTINSTYAGASVVANGSMSSCGDATTGPTRGQNNNNNNVAPNNGEARQ
jgi:hypothetical protein